MTDKSEKVSNDRQNLNSVTEPIIDPWLLEKSDKVLKSLSELVDFVLDEETLEENQRRFMLSKLSHILWNATKIMASAGQDEWLITDRDIILENGHGGYKALAAKYKKSGLSYITEWDVFWERLEQFLDKPRANGSAIHELLRWCVVKDTRVHAIRGLTEALVMGELSWGDYVETVSGYNPIYTEGFDLGNIP